MKESFATSAHTARIVYGWKKLPDRNTEQPHQTNQQHPLPRMKLPKQDFPARKI
ncbi:MAG: hypothetical protein ACOYOU_16120 [Kiritimatiellia bacterium]